MKKVTITVNSHWSDSADVDEFVAVLKNDYDVDGKFNDGGDYNSSWTLTGTPGALKDAVYDHWRNRGLMAWEEVLTDEDMKTLGLTPDPDFDRSVSDMELRLRTTAI